MLLADLQDAFASALAGGEGEALKSCIVEGGVKVDRRLAVYRNNMHHNLREALRGVYPVIEQLVGEAFFDGAASRYIDSHPSASGDLNVYGGAFPAFLQHFPPAAALAYLPDVARLEWALHECLHAADHPPLELIRLEQVPIDSHAALVFRLHPACRLLSSSFPVLRIWEWHQTCGQREGMLDISGEGGHLLVRCSGDTAACFALAEADFVLLHAMSEGESLATALGRALGADPGFDLAACLLRHVAQQTLVDFRVAASTSSGSASCG
jgi:hypothetical protein